MFHIAFARFLAGRPQRLPGDLGQEPCDLVHRRGSTRAEINDLPRDRFLAGEFEGLGQVPHVEEVARLLTVSVDLYWGVRREGGTELRDDARVRRARVLSRAVHVEDSDHDRLNLLE